MLAFGQVSLAHPFSPFSPLFVGVEVAGECRRPWNVMPSPSLSVPYSSGSRLLVRPRGCCATPCPGSFSPLFVGVEVAGALREFLRELEQGLSVPYSSGSRLLADRTAQSESACQAFSPLFVGVEVAGTTRRASVFPEPSLSVPYSSGSRLLVASAGVSHQRRGELSVPYSSGSRLLGRPASTVPAGPRSLSVPYSSGSRLLAMSPRLIPPAPQKLSVPYSSGSRSLGPSWSGSSGRSRTFSPLFVGVEVAGANVSPPASAAATFSPLFVGVEVAGVYSDKEGSRDSPFQSPIRRGRGCWDVQAALTALPDDFQSPIRRGRGCWRGGLHGPTTLSRLSVPYSSGSRLLASRSGG